jgi:hypothetical protein
MNEQTVTAAWDMACPQCGKDGYIEIAMTVWGRLTPDGTDIDAATTGGDHEWTPESPATCCACGYSATVLDFDVSKGDAR